MGLNSSLLLFLLSDCSPVVHKSLLGLSNYIKFLPALQKFVVFSHSILYKQGCGSEYRCFGSDPYLELEKDQIRIRKVGSGSRFGLKNILKSESIERTELGEQLVHRSKPGV